jgi:hypothetical protein
MTMQNTKNEQLSSFLDGELAEQDIESFIDSLLEETPEGDMLVSQLKDFYLLSSAISNKGVEQRVEDNLLFEDRSFVISKQIESESSYSKPSMTELEIKNIPKVFNWFKTMSIGSAIAASFGLIVANLFHTQSVSIPSVAETYHIKYTNLKKNSKDSPNVVDKVIELRQKTYLADNKQLNDKAYTMTPVVNDVSSDSDSAKKIKLINELDKSTDKTNQDLGTFIE